MNYHGEIMNIACDANESGKYQLATPVTAYRYGHRDARHAAAEISVKADAEISKLKARIRELTEWRPMETAPKGGPILGFGQGVCCQIFWNKGAWYTDVGNSHLFYPTGWLPLPRSEAP